MAVQNCSITWSILTDMLAIWRETSLEISSPRVRTRKSGSNRSYRICCNLKNKQTNKQKTLFSQRYSNVQSASLGRREFTIYHWTSSHGLQPLVGWWARGQSGQSKRSLAAFGDYHATVWNGLSKHTIVVLLPLAHWNRPRVILP